MNPELRAALEAAGFTVIGRCTYQGKVQDYTLFNEHGTKIEIDYRHSSEQPDTPSVESGEF